MIAYHYSPVENRSSIAKHGLLVPTKHPKLVQPMVCSGNHRNPHVSLARNPKLAWELSGGFMFWRFCRGDLKGLELPRQWDLYQVYLPRHSYRAFGLELKSRKDIPARSVTRVATRLVSE